MAEPSRPDRGVRRRIAPVWPDGLVGRVVLVLLAALLLELVGSSILFETLGTLAPGHGTPADVTDRLALATRVLAQAAPHERQAVADALSEDWLRLAWAALPSGSGPNPGSVLLPDGSLLRYVATPRPAPVSNVVEALFSTAVLAACLLGAAALTVNTLGAPLRQLARVADTIGRGPPVTVSGRGPHEVRRVARALNAMQARVTRLLADRTEALAAVSHDLRTPIARLRLRAGFLDDAEAGGAIEADLAEMEAMIDAVLAFLSGEADPEPRRTVDLAAILATLVDDATDSGRDASYRGPDHAVLRARPLELKRAVGNLIDNALKYGGCAHVELDVPDPATVRVRVLDRGAGIPDAELDRVFEPFRRVDASRNAGTGGLGLGLAIVRRAVERDGGRVTLRNRPQGGLCAEVVLPAAPGA